MPDGESKFGDGTSRSSGGNVGLWMYRVRRWMTRDKNPAVEAGRIFALPVDQRRAALEALPDEIRNEAAWFILDYHNRRRGVLVAYSPDVDYLS